MKETIIAFTIVALVLLTCFYSANAASTFCDELKRSVEKCMSSAYEESWDTVESEIKHAKELFEQKSPLIEMISLHQKVDEVGTLIAKIQAAASIHDRAIVITEARCLISHLDMIASSDSLTLRNIL